MIPKTDNTTSYFSFFDVSQKVSIVLGMTLFAILDQTTGSMRASILIFVLIFLVGAFLLNRIKLKNI
jgi:UMF1 family MFS transporter